jgi:hypothetical protein
MVDVLTRMRLIALTFAASVASLPVSAAQPSPVATPSVQEPISSSAQDDAPPNLPVSLDKIKDALTSPPSLLPLRGLNDKPTFTIEVRQKQQIKIDDLLASMDFRSGPAVPGGLYGYEQDRLAFPAVDNPLRQPYAAFSQSELLTIVIENLAARYLGGRALNAVTSAERARAEQAARDEVQRALAGFWAQKTAAPATPKP